MLRAESHKAPRRSCRWILSRTEDRQLLWKENCHRCKHAHIPVPGGCPAFPLWNELSSLSIVISTVIRSLISITYGQVVVGRTGDQTLTSESGDVTRCVPGGYMKVRDISKHPTLQLPPCLLRYAKCCCSHLQGMFFRTAKMLEIGMKPV